MKEGLVEVERRGEDRKEWRVRVRMRRGEREEGGTVADVTPNEKAVQEVLSE